MPSPRPNPKKPGALGWLLERGEFWAAMTTRNLFRILPLRTALGFGGWCGRRMASLPMARRRIEDNLSLLGPEWRARDSAALVRGVGEATVRLGVEYNNLHRIAARPEMIRIQGEAHLRAAIAAGGGVILVSAHYGSWETIRIATRRLGFDCAFIYRTFDNRPFDAEAMRLTRSVGEPVWRKGPSGLRAMMRHVRGGGLVLILVDQRSTGAPLIPFLGRPAETVLAPAELALKTGAALMPACSRRAKDGLSFDIAFEAPVEGPSAEAMMTGVNARIGAWIEHEPAQWFWYHRRWKIRRPPE